MYKSLILITSLCFVLTGCGGDSNPSSTSSSPNSSKSPLEQAKDLLNSRQAAKAKALIQEHLAQNNPNWEWSLIQERLKAIESKQKLNLDQLKNIIQQATQKGEVLPLVHQLVEVLGSEFKLDALSKKVFTPEDMQWYSNLYQKASQINVAEAKTKALSELSSIVIKEGDKLLNPKTLESIASILNINLNEMNLHYLIETNKVMNSGAVDIAKKALNIAGFNTESLSGFLNSIDSAMTTRGKSSGPKIDPATVAEGKESIKALLESMK